MGRTPRVIDFLDLSLPLPSSETSVFEEALEKFDEEHLHIEIAPKLKRGALHINSTDLISFMGYLDSTLLSEMALKRFQKECITGLDQLLLRSVAVDHQAHYKWCMAAVKSLEVGRFLEEEGPECANEDGNE